YGLTTALGANGDIALVPLQFQSYQSRAISARSVGVSGAAPDVLVRDLTCARLAGHSGRWCLISILLFNTVPALLNFCICVIVPRIGSIGVADLPAMSHAMLVLLGQGRARLDGAEMRAEEALSAAGLSPVVLGPKDGLALISSNAWSISCAIDAFDKAS